MTALDPREALREARHRLVEALKHGHIDEANAVRYVAEFEDRVAALAQAAPPSGLNVERLARDLYAVQHYTLTIEPDDSAYMELDPGGRYVIFEEVESVFDAALRSPDTETAE